MRLRVAVILFLCLTALLAQPVAPTDSRGWINKGVQEYKGEKYKDAVESFQKAMDLDPNNVTARLYLATAFMSQYIPGAESPENTEMARKAEDQFTRVLQIEPVNTTALVSMASLMYQQAQGMPDLDQKIRKLDEAASWYEKLIAADPQNKEAYYSLGVIDWVKWYAAYLRTRTDLGMRPEQPGPLPNPARQELKQQYSSMIEHGISSLEKALQIDPQYSDAMAYMNLLIRERADLAESPEQYRSETALADQWVQKALDSQESAGQCAVRGAPTSAAVEHTPTHPGWRECAASEPYSQRRPGISAAGRSGSHPGHGSFHGDHRPRRTRAKPPVDQRPSDIGGGCAPGRGSMGISAYAAQWVAGRSGHDFRSELQAA